MKRILLFSDSHGRTENIKKILRQIPDIDYVLFLGDCLRDIYPVEQANPEIHFHYVPGNNDFGSSVPGEKMIAIDGVRIFMAHGHQYQVKMTNNRISYRTEELQCQIGLFGHTHRAAKLQEGGILLLNPGSISLPYGGAPSYGIIEIENGKASADILFI